MVRPLTTLHLSLALVLIAGYAFLALREFRARTYRAYEIVLAQLLRFSLLLAYLTGLLLSMNAGRMVSQRHHLLSLSPAAVILCFQVIPRTIGKEIGRIGAAIMFAAMSLAILLIALSAR